MRLQNQSQLTDRGTRPFCLECWILYAEGSVHSHVGVAFAKRRHMAGLYVARVLVSPRLVLRPPRPALFRPPRPFVLSHPPRRLFASHPPPAHRALLARLLPKTFRPSPDSGSSLRKVISLAKPERKPLFLAICLLLVSSSVAMTIPLTIGKLIDFFSADDPVSAPACSVSSEPYSAPRARVAHTVWTLDLPGFGHTPRGVYDRCSLQRHAIVPHAHVWYVLIFYVHRRRTEWLTMACIQVNGSSLGSANGPTKLHSAKKLSLSKKARATC